MVDYIRAWWKPRTVVAACDINWFIHDHVGYNSWELLEILGGKVCISLGGWRKFVSTLG